MRKIVLAVAIVGAGLTLAGCSKGTEGSADASAEGVVAQPEANSDAPGQSVEKTSAAANARLDGNTTTAAQLVGANGVSPELADAIVAGRPYATVLDLHAKLRETLSQEAAAAVLVNVFVPVNLNTASRAEIELIPGMSSRLVGEFLEYRPYEDVNEFNREIGKYVDEAEVARFRSYVTL